MTRAPARAPTDGVKGVVSAFIPPVDGITEVFHARWKDHTYPLHTHAAWAVMLVDDGAIGYDLDRRSAVAPPRAGVTILPPDVPHDGHALTDGGFRKRVIYLDHDLVDVRLTGASVKTPFIDDPHLRALASRLDSALLGHDWFEAANHLALTTERLTGHLRGHRDTRLPPSTGGRLATATRAWLDEDLTRTDGLASIAEKFGVSVPHLIRSYTATFGISPHRYLLSRRLEHARQLLLADVPPAHVAARAGFYDQAHLNRHFTTFLGTTPGRYQRSHPRVPGHW